MLERQLSEWVGEAFRAAFPETDFGGAEFAVYPTKDESFGDYQCNAAMKLAGILKTAPRNIARAAVDAQAPPEEVDRVEVAGPGFINLFLKNSALAGALEEMGGDRRLGVPDPGQGRTVIMDYSSPNVAKPMHIGHIRSTVIGNALDRLYRFAGYEVISDNHLGDWGTQFGLLILGYRHFRDGQALEDHPAEELERIYVESYNRSKEDDTWRDQARQELVKLQQGDEENLELWRTFVELSLKEFGAVYDRLGVRFDLVRGESWYHDRLPDVIGRLESAGLAEESEGALICDLSDEDLKVCIVRKKDGAYNYATTDIATLLAREEEFAPERIIYVTDERQQLHFRQVFHVSRALGVKPDLVHVWFGLMRLPEATFSTREGNVIKLEALLDEAERRALEVVKTSSPEMPADQQREVARAVGIGAVKYVDLSQNPQSLVTFTWDKALAMDGNSAPYLQYAHARIASVRDRYRERFPEGRCDDWPIRIEEPVERRLAGLLTRFPAAVLGAAEQYRPNILADYLYNLSQVYSSFYQNVPFLKAEEGVRESRVRLCDLVARVLKTGLDLLGIEAPERI
ncbi:arginine--tRNA ligase [Kiritimatiella glycovorans]|uniref:Arginine--tRNA ligase n=1 Tax=Kiritimatiella glycovorans TaxID=1307763 RepID=A0A0G3ED45_9BACT|nr:arginine--tRNA ligase [Kiritimatiella glycovorans]AKJ64243.1 Arginine--tRNA ligase [Kiritimatiella glycovorans]